MPKGPQSLVGFISTNFTAQTAADYKAKIDAANAINSQVASSLYVYPTTPQSMAVNIDVGYNLPAQANVSFSSALQAGAAPLALGLTATSVSRWATIFWDATANVASLIYTTSNPIYPTSLKQHPIAQVFIPANATSIAAANINDLRSFLPTGSQATNVVSLGNLPLNTETIVSCNGLSDIQITANLNAANGVIRCTGLRVGVRVSFLVFSTAGAARALFIRGTRNDGAAYNVVTINSASGATIDMDAVGVSINSSAGPNWFFGGNTIYNDGVGLYLTATL